MENQKPVKINAPVVAEKEVVAVGVEVTKEYLEMAGDIAAAAKKIWKDKKFDMNDTVHVLPVIQAVPRYIELIDKRADMIAEIKKPTVSKVLEIIQAVDAQVKKFEKA